MQQIPDRKKENAMTWIIEDWMSKRVFPDKTFDSFEEARDFITEHANAKDEAEHDGICEDLYAVEIMDPLDALLIDTREQARDFAIDWQRWSSEQNLSYGELAEWQNVFVKLADKFDLNDEFTENAII